MQCNSSTCNESFHLMNLRFKTSFKQSTLTQRYMRGAKGTYIHPPTMTALLNTGISRLTNNLVPFQSYTFFLCKKGNSSSQTDLLKTYRSVPTKGTLRKAASSFLISLCTRKAEMQVRITVEHPSPLLPKKYADK